METGVLIYQFFFQIHQDARTVSKMPETGIFCRRKNCFGKTISQNVHQVW